MKQTDIFLIMDLAKRARENGDNFNPLFSGPPGVGKSQIVQQWAEKNNYPLIDIRPAYFEAPDMIGYPTVEVRNGRQITIHNTPEIWPDPKELPFGVLLLEEVNRAQPSTMNALMQLLTDRKVHNYKLPEGWIIAACINPDNGANDVNHMDSALKDRFEIFNIEYDKKTFTSYMNDKNWDIGIVQFIESNSWIFKNPEDIGNVEGSKYLSPRSWSKANSAIKAGIPEELEYQVYQELLGQNTGKAFFSFRKDEIPVTYEDLLTKEKESLGRLKKYSNPENLKNAQLSITIRSMIENAKEVNANDDILIKVALTLPADQATSMISNIEYKLELKAGSIFERICKKDENALKYFKYTLKKEKK